MTVPPTTHESDDGHGDEPAPPVPIVALGGSAGGLEALKEFFGVQPVDSGCAFVVVTHQHPQHASMLPEILNKTTGMPVAKALDGTAVAPDHVYVAVPDHQLTIEGGVFVQGDPPDTPGKNETTSGRHHPIDAFFRALAADRHELAVAVVLSGSGTDGSVGLKDIKTEAGMVLVQQPDTAEFDSMPSSALATGLVDHSLPVNELPQRIAHYVHGVTRQAADEVGVSEDVKDEIVTLLREHTGNDFSGYKRATLVRRIQRRMEIRHIERGSEYVDELRREPGELDHLFREIIVIVTRFFRDHAAWDALDPALREYIAALPEDAEFRAWVMGCASGEEAYTLAIVATEAMEAQGRRLPMQIIATDIEPGVIETAREGRYPTGIANDVPARLLEKYFHRAEDHYIAHKGLREKILFAVHNALQDPPFTRIDLLSCRNLLIYLDDDLQRRLRPVFGYALKPEGLLLLGSAETIDQDQYDNHFTTVDRGWKIFRRGPQKTSHRALSSLPLRRTQRGHGGPSLGKRPERDQSSGASSRTIERALLQHNVPPSVVVSENGDAVWFHGDTGHLLAPSPGVPGNNVLAMARKGLRSTLREALREAAGQPGEIIRRRARVHTIAAREWFTITVTRLDDPESVRGLLLVSFQPEPTAGASTEEAEPAQAEAGADAQNPGSDTERVAQLERELEAVSAEKSGAVEELESTNEDLQAANEELQSANEELQSTNEELETSREEMESLNEELTALNSELQDKVGQLERANNDMSNMLNSTDFALLFLSRDLEVRRYTERMSDLMSIREADIGRPVGDLTSNLRYDRLVEDAGEVLRTLQNREVEIQSKGGYWFLLRILPYRTLEHEIDGVVCTFIDIDRVKRTEFREAYFHSIVETVREPLVVLDDDLRVVSATGNFYDQFALRDQPLEGERLFELAGGQWDQPELRRLVEEILPQERALTDFAIEVELAGVGRKRLLLNARQLERAAGEPGMILLAMEVRDGGEHDP